MARTLYKQTIYRNSLYKSAESGVTLLELSLAIVAVGLLMGTLLSSSLLINNAKTNAMVSEMYKYKTTFLMFKLRYYAIPGDMPNASMVIQDVATSQNGDGNMKITFGVDDPGETLLPWVHLEKAGFIQNKPKKQYSGSPCCDSGGWGVSSLSAKNGPNVAMPRIPNNISNIMGENNIPVYMMFYSDGYVAGNKLGLTWSTQGIERPFYAPIAPIEQYRIDVKYDDGLPLTGNIIGVTGNIINTDIEVRNSKEDTCFKDKNYLITPQTPGAEGCILTLKLDN